MFSEQTFTRRARLNGRILTFAAAIAVLLYISARATIVLADGGDVITVVPAQAKAGEQITINGSGYGVGEEVELILDGVRGSTSLGNTNVGETGSFEFVSEIPAGTAAGQWQLAAVTEDDRATFDFAVLSGGTSGAGGKTVLTFERSTTETVVIGLLAALATLVGGALVYWSREPHRQG